MHAPAVYKSVTLWHRMRHVGALLKLMVGGTFTCYSGLPVCSNCPGYCYVEWHICLVMSCDFMYINTLRPDDAYICIYRWVSGRKTQLQCVSNGVTSFLHQPIDMWLNRINIGSNNGLLPWSIADSLTTESVRVSFDDNVLKIQKEKSHQCLWFSFYQL